MPDALNKRFYSFEGIDFSGKSTQITLLKDELERHGHKVYVLREPGGTDISEKIRAILLDKANTRMSDMCEIFLYSAARTQLVNERIRPLLEKDYFVIADRYVDSTTAYQGFGRGLDAAIVRNINQAATGGLMPAITWLLDLNEQQADARRIGSGRSTDRLEEAGREFYRRVRAGYLEIAKKEPQRMQVLDAAQDVGAIHQQILQTVLFREK